MPTVGKKTFPYTKKGKMAAKKVAKKTGQKMFNSKKYEATKKKVFGMKDARMEEKGKM